jgi:hypothetical protein
MKIKPAYIIVGIVIVVVAVFALPRLFAEAPGSRSTSGSEITETITVTDTDAEATFNVVLIEGADAEHESSHMFEALAGIVGVGQATLDTETLELTVAYDSSAVGDSIIREQLVTAGYIVPSVADATPAEVSEDGSVQRIAVTDDGIQFDPYLIRAEAGIPLEIDFGPAQECRVSVSIPDAGIETQDLSQGAVVAVAALEPGQYDIICSGGGVDGSIIVE